ncbi:PadR family transcriptional regulator [Sphingomonas sp.]|uniref:PadR family transcriptional regulator n=1 Tax=Sphingomonas sp. TaxID=28214 RepID=UPI002E0FC4C5|nr:PadR family transcriptional regulator [Sphingomonas sp.]
MTGEAPGGGGRGRRRMFAGDELRLVLLALIADQPRHGYDLIREIEERTGGAYAPSPGVVYPTLTLLADMDHIAEQAAEGAKKLYAITATGQAHLGENAEQVTLLMGRLAELGTQREKSGRSPVRRAMGNLKMAVMQRLNDGETDQETVDAIVDIIDAAARKVERL